MPVYYDWASQCLAWESPKYLSCHSDSSVRLCLSVSLLAWELSMVEGWRPGFSSFSFFFFFVLCSFRFFFCFVCAYMYVNFIDCRSVGHCIFCVSAVCFVLSWVIVTRCERIRRVASHQFDEIKGVSSISSELKTAECRSQLCVCVCVCVSGLRHLHNVMMYSETAHSSFQGWLGWEVGGFLGNLCILGLRSKPK